MAEDHPAPPSRAMRWPPARRVLGILAIYRTSGGGLVAAGLSYAALFALIPTLALVIAGIYLLVDDPTLRSDAVGLIDSAFPALEELTGEAVAGARDVAAAGGIIALIGFLWGASGLYLNLTRAMERFFPGERVSGVLARVVGMLLVLLIIGGVLVAVIVAGLVTVVARALELDAEWLLGLVSAAATLVVAAGIVYAIYRVIPANPPSAPSARLPAALVGVIIAGMTLLYGLISPWLVSGFAAFGVAASVFVALVWLRLIFLAMVYGAAMTRYRDYVAAAKLLDEPEPDLRATEYALAEESERAAHDADATRETERHRGGTGGAEADSDGD